MATTITHLVVGERVFAQLPRLTPAAYGAFLLGCALVDAYGFGGMEWRQTHFAERSKLGNSCANFVSQLDTLLRRPWGDLAETDQAFVAGYLCHLATDAAWADWLRALDVTFEVGLAVPDDVMRITLNALSREMFVDFDAIVSALKVALIPNVLTHVPHDAFQRMWDATRSYTLAGGTVEAYLELREDWGKTRAEIQAIRRQHSLHRETMVALTRNAGGIESHVQAAVEWSLCVVPQLWGDRF
jgi:hypothetical protein